MAFARWQASIQDAEGNIVPNAMVEVRREGGGLVQLFADRAGATPMGNPFAADANGFAFFHTSGGAFRVRAYLGTFEQTWRYVAVGLGGESDLSVIPLGADVPQVDTLSDRAAYNGEPEGFRIIVSNVGDGRAAFYTMGGGGSGDWSEPAYITGAPGTNGGDRFDLAFFIQGKPRAAEMVGRHTFSDASIIFPAALSTSRASAGAATTAEKVFIAKKNGVEFATVTFAASGTAGAFACPSETTFNAGDVLSVFAPSVRDATLADISMTFAGSR